MWDSLEATLDLYYHLNHMVYVVWVETLASQAAVIQLMMFQVQFPIDMMKMTHRAPIYEESGRENTIVIHNK